MDYTTRQIALERIHILFRLAQKTIGKNPELAQRYVHIARKIAMATRVRIPREYRRQVCRRCKRFIYPGVNCRVRIQSGGTPHVVITCLDCGKRMRLPLRRKEKVDYGKNEEKNKA